MDFSKMTNKQIERLINIFQDQYVDKYGELSDHNKSKILKEFEMLNMNIY